VPWTARSVGSVPYDTNMCSRHDDSRAPLERLEEEITTLAGHLNAATCRWLLLIGEYDRREGWAPWGCRSCAQWLSWRCAIGLGTAREQVRVARALDDLPLIRAAFAAGRLSYSQARALTRVATPELEDGLLELARHATGGQLERLVRGYRSAAEQLEAAEGAHAGRYVLYHHDDDGSLVIQARLPAAEGELVLAALASAGEALEHRQRAAAVATTTTAAGVPGGVSAEARNGRLAEGHVAGDDNTDDNTDGDGDREGDDRHDGDGDGDGDGDTQLDVDLDDADASAETPSPPRLRADALVAMAETTLEHGPSPRAGGDRTQVLLLVDHETLRGDLPGRCEVGEGEPLAPETARRLACDASLVPVRTHDGRPLAVGRRTRSIPPHIRRALTARDGGCRFPGCGQRQFVDAHHIVHWARGGETDLSNLVLLCRHHHRLLHEGGCSVRPRAGGLAFHRPDGRRIPDRHRPCGGDRNHVPHASRRLGLTIDAETTVPRWNGDPLDVGLTTELLLWRAQHRPRPTTPA